MLMSARIPQRTATGYSAFVEILRIGCAFISIRGARAKKLASNHLHKKRILGMADHDTEQMPRSRGMRDTDTKMLKLSMQQTMILITISIFVAQQLGCSIKHTGKIGKLGDATNACVSPRQ